MKDKGLVSPGGASSGSGGGATPVQEPVVPGYFGCNFRTFLHSSMKSCLLLIGSVVVGFGIGLGVTVILCAITGNNDLASAIGTGVWLISVLTILAYTSLWFAEPYEIANPSRPSTTIQKWRAQKADNKLQTAELRMGFVFAMIGGGMASIAKGSNLVITIVAICCAGVGGLIGFDVKRRVLRLRKRFGPQNESADD